jgi:hypothetical protein
MALLNTDFFVIQRPTDSNKHYKLNGEMLKEFIAGGESVNYKGSRNFRDAAVDPSTDGTGVQNGDLYINDNPDPGKGAWVASILNEDVEQGDKAVWNEANSKWDFIPTDSGYVGVESIIGLEPITVDDTVKETPQVGVYTAIKTDAGIPISRSTRSGVVESIAIQADVNPSDILPSPNPLAVVPAELLKTTNEDVLELQEDVEEIKKGSALSELKGDQPIDITTTLPNADGKTETTVSIFEALKTDASPAAPRAVRSGAVSAIAVESDVAADTNNASPNPLAAVPAELLKKSNEDIVALDGRVTVNEGDIVNINAEIDNIKKGGSLSALKGTDPIEVTTELIDPGAIEGDPNFEKTETTVSIKDGTTTQKGAVALQPLGTTSTTGEITATTPSYIDKYYVPKPGTEGSYVVVEDNAGAISFSETIDGGTY